MDSAALARYQRHLSLPEVGVAGQEAFGRARVLIVGAGGLGSPAAVYLAAAGVGTIGLVDRDEVDASNLQRQILYREQDVGRPKLQAAAAALRAVNSRVEVVCHETWLTSANALDIIPGYDLVVAGADNFPARYLVNDACVLSRTPCVDGSIYRFEGQATVYDTVAGGPCYRCRFPSPPPPGSVPSCAEAGVLGVVAGLVGCIQATEALKLTLLRAGVSAPEPLIGRLLVIDTLAMTFDEYALRRDPACPVCGDAPTLTELIDYDEFCRGPHAAEPAGLELEPAELARLHQRGEVTLLDVREAWEWQLCRLDGALHVPLGELPARLGELPDGELVAYCHAGVRSLKAVELLRTAGRSARSLRGGIHAWSIEIDDTVPRY